MSVKKGNQSSIIISMIIGKISSAIGYFLIVFTGLGIIGGALEDSSTLIIVFCFIPLGVVLVIYGIKTKRLILSFRNYINIISIENQTSLERIASITSKSVEVVENDLQRMINKKYFINAYIDRGNKEIVLKERKGLDMDSDCANDKHIEMEAVSCKSCGASNNIIKGTSKVCEFCGTALILK